MVEHSEQVCLCPDQPPWSESSPSETHLVENSEWRKIGTKGFLNPKSFHSVYFKDPSNDAHQAITALHVAFFSTQLIYNRLGNKAIFSSGLGKEDGSYSHLIQLCPSLSRGKETVGRGGSRSGREALLPSLSLSWL